MARLFSHVFLAVLALTLTSSGAQKNRAVPTTPSSLTAGYTRAVLPNGILVGVVTIPDCDRVAVEAIYKVGFMHEPLGMPQAAHLLEHLVANGKIPGYSVGEVMRQLNQNGMANAETLPSFTHYDYVAPLADLEKILNIEAARLQHLEFDAALIKAEAQKCYEEADFVEKNRASGMVKHAFMALNQAWSYGARKARVRGGLETLKVEDLREFHKRAYNPSNLMILIAGGLSGEDGIALARKALGAVPKGPVLPPRPVNWDNTAEHNTLFWDVSVKGFCLGYVPPNNARDRLLLTLLGSIMLPKLQNNPELKETANMVFCSNTTWPVGALPFFIYAAPKTNTSLLKLQQTIIEQIEAADAKKPSGPDMQQLKLIIAELISRPNFTMPLVQQQAAVLSQQTSQPTAKAVDTVVANIALQIGLRELLLEEVAAKDLNEIARMTAEEIEAVLTRTTLLPSQSLNIVLPDLGG